MEGIGIVGFRNDAVDGRGPARLDVGPGRIEVDIAGDAIALPDQGFEEDPLGRPSLMRGNDVTETEDVPDGFFEVEIIPGSRVGLVARHHPGPLVVAHGRGARIRQEIDRDFIGRNLENVVPRLLQEGFPFPADRHRNGLDDFDPERLQRRPDIGHSPSPFGGHDS